MRPGADALLARCYRFHSVLLSRRDRTIRRCLEAPSTHEIDERLYGELYVCAETEFGTCGA
ncbi:hypothetical protein BIW11_02856 [Tropilaelaps mercedesae]|uniref:Uncharacterized protein n=1 Tax=Tropilaelaps mercedesae TaxID=418985 RepID=A0A1V9XWQ3_9ACAR|nr:hypothetical protein BIW11_02856 [Tropilaelaps mercedesae]